MYKRIATSKLDNVEATLRTSKIDSWESMLAAVELGIEATTRKEMALKRSAAILKAKIESGEPFLAGEEGLKDTPPGSV
jgi:hypothetical protein